MICRSFGPVFVTAMVTTALALPGEMETSRGEEEPGMMSGLMGDAEVRVMKREVRRCRMSRVSRRETILMVLDIRAVAQK